jgi:hypothetical protein
MLESVYWFQLLTVFVITDYNGQLHDGLIYESKSDIPFLAKAMFGSQIKGKYVNILSWQAVYYMQCNDGKYIELAELPSKTQAIALSRAIEGSSHQPYGDNSNEKIMNDDYTIESFTYNGKSSVNVEDLPFHDGVKAGMEDWSQPAK